jgi:hypothetical protein
VSGAFSIQNRLKLDVLSPLRFSIVLEYTITKVKESGKELELNGTHQLMVCALLIPVG